MKRIVFDANSFKYGYYKIKNFRMHSGFQSFKIKVNVDNYFFSNFYKNQFSFFFKFILYPI